MNAQDTLSRKEIRKEQANFLLQDRPWTIEIPLWIPGYAGNFAYGDVDIEGEDGVDPEHPIEPPDGIGGIFSRLFSDDWYLNFFFMTRIAYEKNRFIAQTDALTGSVGESVKFKYNNTEIVSAHYRTTNIRIFGGSNLWMHLQHKGISDMSYSGISECDYISTKLLQSCSILHPFWILLRPGENPL
jgi:hypothetical protein